MWTFSTFCDIFFNASLSALFMQWHQKFDFFPLKLFSWSPSMAGKFRWKRTFIGSWHLIEDNHHWKTKFDGKQPTTEDNLQQKTHINKRTSMLDNLGLKMTSYKKLYVMWDDLVLCLYNDPKFNSSIVTKSIGLLKDSFYIKLSLYYKHDKLNECTN